MLSSESRTPATSSSSPTYQASQYPKVRANGAIPGMEGGTGESSYTKNSYLQSQAIAYLKPILQEEISQLQLSAEGPIHVGDLGCSVGENTLQYAEILFRAVQENFLLKLQKVPDIQYFFSDLPSSDFNTLFQQLRPWMVAGKGIEERKSFYAAAAPGSFHGRLFPSASLHVAISVYALHWTSQVPPAVQDKHSHAYNKGRIWIEGGSPTVAAAYAELSKQDMRNFFASRAHEIPSGGLLVVYFIGRKDEEHVVNQWRENSRYASPFSQIVEDTWEDLVAEGLMDEETRDSFNLPVYIPSVKEVTEAADWTDAFHIKRVELRGNVPYFPEGETKRLLSDPEAFAKYYRTFNHSLMGSLVEGHVGKELAHKYFDRLEQNAATAARNNMVQELSFDNMLGVFIRK